MAIYDHVDHRSAANLLAFDDSKPCDILRSYNTVIGRETNKLRDFAVPQIHQMGYSYENIEEIVARRLGFFDFTDHRSLITDYCSLGGGVRSSIWRNVFSYINTLNHNT